MLHKEVNFQFPFQEEKDKMEKIKKDKEMLKEDISEVRLGNIQCTVHPYNTCTCITLLIKLNVVCIAKWQR